MTQLTNSEATTPAIPMASYGGAQLIFPAGMTSISMDVYAAANDTDTFVPLYDSTGTAVSITIGASGAYELPVSVYTCAFVKLVTDADDSALDVQVIRKG